MCGLAGVHVWYRRCDGSGYSVITHAFACVGGGSFVCQFACCVFAIFGIFGVTAVFACAWSRASLDYIYRVGTRSVPCDLSSLCLFVIHRSTGGSHRYES